MNDRIRVGCLQLGTVEGETKADRVARVLEDLRLVPDADLVVLPELWDVGYFSFDRYRVDAETLGAGPAAALGEVACDRGFTLVAGSLLERDGDHLFNTVVVVGSDGAIAGTYRKRNLFGHESRETELLTPGAAASVVATPVGRVGLATCFDLRFPAHFAELRDAGADMVVVPAAWPAERSEHWRVLVQARAIELQTPVVACNGAGVWQGVELAGCSMVVDARGAVRGQTHREPGWLGAQIDHADTAAWRAEFPLGPRS